MGDQSVHNSQGPGRQHRAAALAKAHPVPVSLAAAAHHHCRRQGATPVVGSRVFRAGQQHLLPRAPATRHHPPTHPCPHPPSRCACCRRSAPLAGCRSSCRRRRSKPHSHAQGRQPSRLPPPATGTGTAVHTPAAELPAHVASRRHPAPSGPSQLSVPVASMSPGRRLQPPAVWWAIICGGQDQLACGLALASMARGMPSRLPGCAREEQVAAAQRCVHRLPHLRHRPVQRAQVAARHHRLPRAAACRLDGHLQRHIIVAALRLLQVWQRRRVVLRRRRAGKWLQRLGGDHPGGDAGALRAGRWWWVGAHRGAGRAWGAFPCGGMARAALCLSEQRRAGKRLPGRASAAQASQPAGLTHKVLAVEGAQRHILPPLYVARAPVVGQHPAKDVVRRLRRRDGAAQLVACADEAALQGGWGWGVGQPAGPNNRWLGRNGGLQLVTRGCKPLPAPTPPHPTQPSPRGCLTISSSKSSWLLGRKAGACPAACCTWPHGRRTSVPDTTTDDALPW